VLEVRVKDEDQTTKSMEVRKTGRVFGAAKNFLRRHGGWARCGIVNGNSMLQRKRPEVLMNNIRPVDHSMDQHGTSVFRDGMDVTLSNPISVVSINTAESNALTTYGARIPKEFYTENAVICMVALNKVIEANSMELKAMFGHHSFFSPSRIMKGEEQIPACVVDKESPSSVTLALKTGMTKGRITVPNGFVGRPESSVTCELLHTSPLVDV